MYHHRGWTEAEADGGNTTQRSFNPSVSTSRSSRSRNYAWQPGGTARSDDSDYRREEGDSARSRRSGGSRSDSYSSPSVDHWQTNEKDHAMSARSSTRSTPRTYDTRTEDESPRQSWGGASSVGSHGDYPQQRSRGASPSSLGSDEDGYKSYGGVGGGGVAQRANQPKLRQPFDRRFTSEKLAKGGADPAFPNPYWLDRDGKERYTDPKDWKPMYSSLTSDGEFPTYVCNGGCGRLLPSAAFSDAVLARHHKHHHHSQDLHLHGRGGMSCTAQYASDRKATAPPSPDRNLGFLCRRCNAAARSHLRNQHPWEREPQPPQRTADPAAASPLGAKIAKGRSGLVLGGGSSSSSSRRHKSSKGGGSISGGDRNGANAAARAAGTGARAVLAARTRRSLTAGCTLEEGDEEDEEGVEKEAARSSQAKPPCEQPRWKESLRRGSAAYANKKYLVAKAASGREDRKNNKVNCGKGHHRGPSLQVGKKASAKPPRPASAPASGRKPLGTTGVVQVASAHWHAELLR